MAPVAANRIEGCTELDPIPRGEQEMAMALMQQGRTDKTLQLTSQGSE
jgi:hypothetical protein